MGAGDILAPDRGGGPVPATSATPSSGRSASDDRQRRRPDRLLPRRAHGADPAARRVHGAGVRGAADPGPVEGARAGRAGHLPRPAHRPAKEQGWKAYAGAVLAFSVASFALLYAILRLQGHLPLNPADLPGMTWFTAFNTAASFVTNTNWQYYGGRVDPVVPQPDVRARRAELRLGGRRHGRARGRHPRLRPPRPRRARQLLGRPGADHALHPAAAGDRARPADRAPRASSRPSTTRSPTRPSRRARSASPTRPAQPATQTITRGPGRVADRHQAARHQRRRLLQLQLGGPLREPDAADQLPRDAGDPADPGGAHLHLRGHGRLARAGLGALRGDDDRAGGRDRHRGALRAARGPRSCSRPASS